MNVLTNVHRRPEEGAVDLPAETEEGIPEEVVSVPDLKRPVENFWMKW